MPYQPYKIWGIAQGGDLPQQPDKQFGHTKYMRLDERCSVPKCTDPYVWYMSWEPHVDTYKDWLRKWFPMAA